MTTKLALDDLFERRLTFPDVVARERLAALVGLDDHKQRLIKILSFADQPGRLVELGCETPPQSEWITEGDFAAPATGRSLGRRGLR